MGRANCPSIFLMLCSVLSNEVTSPLARPKIVFFRSWLYGRRVKLSMFGVLFVVGIAQFRNS
jgi:hypothetical protein